MKLIEYSPPPTARKVAAVIFFVSLLLRAALLGFSLFGGLTVAGKVTVPLLNLVVLISALFIIRKHRVPLFIITGALIVVSAVYLLLCNDGAEYHFTSPGGESTLVVREKSALLSLGWAETYTREYAVMLKPLEVKIGTDDNYQPFAHGQYRIEWADENSASVYYYDGHGYKQINITL